MKIKEAPLFFNYNPKPLKNNYCLAWYACFCAHLGGRKTMQIGQTERKEGVAFLSVTRRRTGGTPRGEVCSKHKA